VVLRRSRRWKKGIGEVVFSSGGWGRVERTIEGQKQRLVRGMTGLTGLRSPGRIVGPHGCEERGDWGKNEVEVKRKTEESGTMGVLLWEGYPKVGKRD
jgi:hypothetical protein